MEFDKSKEPIPIEQIVGGILEGAIKSIRDATERGIGNDIHGREIYNSHVSDALRQLSDAYCTCRVSPDTIRCINMVDDARSLITERLSAELLDAKYDR